MENSFRDEKPLFDLAVDETAKSHMLEMSRWVKFLAIIGFISVGFMVLAAIFGAMAMTMMGGSSDLAGIGAMGIFLVYIILAAVCFYPAYAMIKFSSLIKPALQTFNQDKFNRALGYLKSLFKYYGIFVIIWIILVILFYVFIGVGRIW